MNKTISVIAAALSIGLGFAATSSATAAPAMGAMQAAQAGIQKSEVTQVRRRHNKGRQRGRRPTFGCVTHRHRTQLPNGRFLIFDHQHCSGNGKMAPRS